MNVERYARLSLAVSVALAGVYVVNLLYSRATSDGTLATIGSFQGLGGVEQVVLLLVMSALFAATIMLRSGESETGGN